MSAARFWTGEDGPHSDEKAAAIDEMTRDDPRYYMMTVGLDLAKSRDIGAVVRITHREELASQHADCVMVDDADITRGQDHVTLIVGSDLASAAGRIAKLDGARPEIMIVDECHAPNGDWFFDYGGRGLSQIVGRTSWFDDALRNLDRIARIRDDRSGLSLKEREWKDKARLKRHPTSAGKKERR